MDRWRALLNTVVTSATEAELAFIAALDYGADAAAHLTALQRVIRAGRFDDEAWFPREVIELGSHGIKAGHEREFTICTLLLIHAVVSGVDRTTDLAEKLAARVKDYTMLPPPLRDAIFEAYTEAGVG